MDTILRGVAGGPEALDTPDLDRWKRHCRHEPEGGAAREVVLVAGRRAGKTSAFTALFACWHLLCPPHEDDALEGSTLTWLIVAPSRRQGREELDAVRVVLDGLGAVGVRYELRERDDLTEVVIVEPVSKVTRRIMIAPPRPNTIRGLSCPLVCFAEAGHFSGDNGSPYNDKELLAATVPATATFKNGVVLFIGSPGQPGTMLERAFAKPSPHAVVLQGASWDLNPRMPLEACREMARAEALGDPERFFQTEFEASRFSSASETFAASADVSLCVEPGRDRTPRGQHVVVGFDPALLRDSSAIVVACHETIEQTVGSLPVSIAVVLECHELRGSPAKPLELPALLDFLARVVRRWPTPSGGLPEVLHDQHYGSEIDRGLRERGIPARQVAMTPAAQTARFTLLAQLIRGGRLSLPSTTPADHELVRQLGSLRVSQLQNGLSKVEGLRRDDLADAAALAIESCLQLPPSSARGAHKIIEFVGRSVDSGLPRYSSRWVGADGMPSAPPVESREFVAALADARASGAWGVELLQWAEREMKLRGLASIDDVADAVLAERRGPQLNGRMMTFLGRR